MKAYHIDRFGNAWWYRAAIEPGSAARAEGGPRAGPRELA